MQSAQTELDFINLYLESLSSKSVRYGDDYMSRTLPSPLRIKRVPHQPTFIEEKAPTSNTANHAAANDDKFQVIIKLLKPSSQFTIGGLSLSDTVHQLKARIYQQQSSLAVNRQRLLLKGKVLADQKTLAELSIQPDAVIHLMVTAAPAAATSSSFSTSPASPPNVATGRFGISAQAEQKLSSPEFWSAVEKAIMDQIGESDAQILLGKMRASLNA
ncbi:hypothetical protein [Parasitella parasitica]|uniref:Ubiquitin-like domain-containing protein n=1 Tax=Parasitella parasitica TaxID=35722 RepID=A0A0B7N2S6_9FUNG|nr:hypothetical protein [Parasitella parasitica]